MTLVETASLERRVLVVAPTSRDGEVSQELLGSTGIAAKRGG